MQEKKTSALLMYIILFTGILCIAWSAIFVKLADVSGLSSAFYRLFIGSLGIIPFWIYYRKPITDWNAVKPAILCGIFFGCDIALWNTSILLSKAAIATLLANLAPVWVGLGALFILKEKPQKIFWVGTLISLFGVMVILGIDKLYNTSFGLGNYLALTASVFYGAYLLTTRKGRSSLDTISFTAISMFTSTLLLLIICAIFGAKLGGFSTKSWLSLIGLGLISQLGGWIAINYTLKYIKPTIASVSLLSQSVFTAILSVPVLGEYLKPIEITGAFFVLLGIYLVNNKGIKSRLGTTISHASTLFRKSKTTKIADSDGPLYE
jgi:drug/metabolite transporter (DMT)-like permease